MKSAPYSEVEPVTELLHQVSVTDPYRWLEAQDSPRTRHWIAAQTRYARSYLDDIPGRDEIRSRVRELLDVETYDSLQKAGGRYFFRRRMPGQEQPCICFREGREGTVEILVDPAERGSGPHTAVRPLRVSSDGRLLLYEVKHGGERMGSFELLDVETRERLRDSLPRGYLRGFAFAPDAKAFYYVHEGVRARSPRDHAVYRHILGTSCSEDTEIFSAGAGDKVRLNLVPGLNQLGFLVIRWDPKRSTDFSLWALAEGSAVEPLVRNAQYRFGPRLLSNGRVLALTDREAPNLRIVEVCRTAGAEAEFFDIVPSDDAPIESWIVCRDRIFVSYLRQQRSEIRSFDFSGRLLGCVPVEEPETIRILFGSEDDDELFVERESFTQPVQVCTYSSAQPEAKVLAERRIPFDPGRFRHAQVWFPAKDRIRIPMFLVGREDVLNESGHPTIMTSYGGFGVSMTPQFSVLVAFLLERGCLFALPNIRGGSEFGLEWYSAAKRQKRQVAFDDFIAAAEWLMETGRTQPDKLAIFGGSNSGLLVGAAMTQRPELFRAVLCMVPMLDMLRYHRFDNAHVWKEEFGTADDPEDFAALFRYSPYQNVREGTQYPATMLVSGDSDQNCNPLHARKMTARLQAANVSGHPIFLDYNPHRGHSPVLPLSERIEALTDRLAFLCDQLQLTA